VDDTGGLSRRTAALIVAGAIVAAVLLFLVAVLIPGFGRVNGATEVVDVGEPISVRVDNALDIRVDITVSSVALLDDVATAAKARDESEVYIVRYGIDGIDAVVPDTSGLMWGLVGTDGTVYEALEQTEGCPGFDEQSGEGCAAVVVPAGVDLCMVRYHGAKTFWYPGKPTPAVTWAGWEF
jgi:hypothetical protein